MDLPGEEKQGWWEKSVSQWLLQREGPAYIFRGCVKVPSKLRCSSSQEVKLEEGRELFDTGVMLKQLSYNSLKT